MPLGWKNVNAGKAGEVTETIPDCTVLRTLAKLRSKIDYKFIQMVVKIIICNIKICDLSLINVAPRIPFKSAAAHGRVLIAALTWPCRR